jgi:hypothetical protein
VLLNVEGAFPRVVGAEGAADDLREVSIFSFRSILDQIVLAGDVFKRPSS